MRPNGSEKTKYNIYCWGTSRGTKIVRACGNKLGSSRWLGVKATSLSSGGHNENCNGPRTPCDVGTLVAASSGVVCTRGEGYDTRECPSRNIARLVLDTVGVQVENIPVQKLSHYVILILFGTFLFRDSCHRWGTVFGNTLPSLRSLLSFTVTYRCVPHWASNSG